MSDGGVDEGLGLHSGLGGIGVGVDDQMLAKVEERISSGNGPETRKVQQNQSEWRNAVGKRQSLKKGCHEFSR